MGKGGGCVPSKNKSPPIITTVSDPNQETESSISIPNEEETTVRVLKIFIVYYSMYGHVEVLAKKIKKGVDSVNGVEGLLFKVPETLSDETLREMRVPTKEDDAVPFITTEKLLEADGFLFGIPTRYGIMAAQIKMFFDSTVELWKNQSLAGIPAGFFVSTGTQGGGQETTAWTAVTQLAHHGMVYVPIGYTFGEEMSKMDTVRGGSPYGAGVFSGDGTRQPTDIELALAEHQGKYMATIVKRSLLPS